MSFIVRPASNADTEGIVRVVKAVYDEYRFTWDAEQYHADLYDVDRFYSPPHVFFVAQDLEGSVLGTVALEVFPPVPGLVGTTTVFEEKVRCAGADCSLERLYVDPSARRRGVGGRLSKIVVQEARLRSRKLMEFWSDKRFEDAHRLYERMGAQVVGDRICDDPDVSPEWGLVLELATSVA